MGEVILSPRPVDLMPRGRRVLVAAAVVGALAAAGQWLGRTSGSTRAERRRGSPATSSLTAPPW
jgi:hypothetical protein